MTRRTRLTALVAVVTLVAGCGVPATTGPGATSLPSVPSVRPTASPTVPSTLPSPAADVALDVVTFALVAPIGVVAAPGDRDQAVIVDQTGQLLVLDGTEVLPEPFLDLRDRMVELMPEYDERGLLGLAFHPDHAANGRLFVYYSAPSTTDGMDHTNVLAEFRARDGDPTRADPDSERRILAIDQPQPNHSGGALGFGPDGLLYLGTGDGGGRGDADAGHAPEGNAQDLDSLLGKVLRVDVDGDTEPAILAYGFRNPWRLSWEPGGAERLIVSDVGYGRYEEIDVVEAGGNYGWRIREGAHCLDLDAPLEDLATCATESNGDPLIDPVLEYAHHDVGVAVVGGYVYRGDALPALRGSYVFADFSAEWGANVIGRGSLLVADPAAREGRWPWRRLVIDGGAIDGFVTGMGEDADGELFVLTKRELGPVGRTGQVLRIIPPAGG